jgi:hypothetical protein
MEKSRMKLIFVQRIGLMSALLLAMYSCIIPRAYSFDSPKWGHDAATSEWFRSLKNSRGESCCDYADGVRLEAPEWRELEDHSFEVFAREKWNKIPPNRVLKGTNRVDMPSFGGEGLGQPNVLFAGSRKLEELKMFYSCGISSHGRPHLSLDIVA